MINLLIVIILSYLVGSIPNGIIVGKLVKGIDIRNYGSGNVGGTNVMRVLGWKYGVLVILLDALKGALAVIVVARLQYSTIPFKNITPFDDFTLLQIMAGSSAVIGHVWTVFAGFRGGKGIATALGFLLAVATTDILMALGVFLITVYVSRYVSLGSILAAIALPLILIVRENVFGVNILGYGTILPCLIFLSLLIVYTHRTNVTRLIDGTESRISLKKKENR